MFKLFGRLLGLQLAWLLCACAMLEVKPERVELTPDNKMFTFVEKAPSGKILSDNEILDLITNQIKAASGVRGVQQYRGESTAINKIRGLDVRRQNDIVTLTYINGDYHISTRSTFKTEIFAEYKVQIRTEGGKKHVVVNTPVLVELKPGNSAIYLPIKPLLKTNEAVADIRKINQLIKPEFEDAFKHAGELNVKYNDESVYANFARILGSYKYQDGDVKKYDIEKDKIFRISEGPTIFPVKVSVYPYRNGSKVLYEFAIPYTIRGDGTTTFDSSRISKYSELVAKVAND